MYAYAILRIFARALRQESTFVLQPYWDDDTIDEGLQDKTSRSIVSSIKLSTVEHGILRRFLFPLDNAYRTAKPALRPRLRNVLHRNLAIGDITPFDESLREDPLRNTLARRETLSSLLLASRPTLRAHSAGTSYRASHDSSRLALLSAVRGCVGINPVQFSQEL